VVTRRRRSSPPAAAPRWRPAGTSMRSVTSPVTASVLHGLAVGADSVSRVPPQLADPGTRRPEDRDVILAPYKGCSETISLPAARTIPTISAAGREPDAPSPANVSAVARPMLPPVPVPIQTFPASRPGISVSFLSRGRELLSLSGAYLTGRLGNLVEVPGTGLTGTAEPPLPDDRTTAWMISMVCRASENDARWVAAGQLAWRSGRGRPGPGGPVGDLVQCRRHRAG
jgi:hypothetical protein